MIKIKKLHSRIYGLCFFLAWSSLSFAQKTYEQTILFATAKSDLSNDSREMLDHIVDSLMELKTFSMVIDGHTDAVGPATYNDTLSKQRAYSVYNYLKSKGLPTDSVYVNFYGEHKPVADNNTRKGRKQNRRADIVINLAERGIKVINTNIWDLYAELKTPHQKFVINTKNDTLIRGREGTLIFIPKEAFNCPEQFITFELQEFYKHSDILSANLSTSSDGLILATRGMTYTNALCNEKSISLKADKEIKMMYPVKRDLPEEVELKVFTGERKGADSTMNWTPTDDIPANLSCFDLFECMPFEGSTLDCPFFFCKIKRFFSGNKANFNDSLIVYPPPGTVSDVVCLISDELKQEYGVETYKELIEVLYREFKVDNMADLYRAMKEIKRKEAEKNIDDGNASIMDLRYYVFETAGLGWINLDYFLKMDSPLMTLVVDLAVDDKTDVALIFKSYFTILPASQKTKYYFRNIPKNEEVLLVGIRYKRGIPSIAINEMTTGKGNYHLNFKEVSLEELKKEMIRLNLAE